MSQALLYPNWREKVVFSTEGHQPTILTETDTVRALVAGLEPGQKIPPHPEAFGMYHFLEGSGWMTVDGERLAVEAGATVFVPQGAVRSLEAETRLAFLAVRVV